MESVLTDRASWAERHYDRTSATMKKKMGRLCGTALQSARRRPEVRSEGRSKVRPKTRAKGEGLERGFGGCFHLGDCADARDREPIPPN